jgi:hypothetical protein
VKYRIPKYTCCWGIILLLGVGAILALNLKAPDLFAISLLRGRYSHEAVLYRLDRLRLGRFTDEDADYFVNQLPPHGEFALFADAELWKLLQERPELTNKIVPLRLGSMLLKKNQEIGQKAWMDCYGQ